MQFLKLRHARIRMLLMMQLGLKRIFITHGGAIVDSWINIIPCMLYCHRFAQLGMCSR